jgi:hypothetical protein
MFLVPSKIWNGTQNKAEVILYSIGTQCFKISLIKLWAQTECGSSFEGAMSGKAKVLRVGKSQGLIPNVLPQLHPKIKKENFPD